MGPDVTVEGATIDSRTARPGQLYVPIVAERDGHEFIRPPPWSRGSPAYLPCGPAGRPVGRATADGVVVPTPPGRSSRLGTLAHAAAWTAG